MKRQGGKQQRRGMTLVEIMVVIVILGVISAAVAVNVIDNMTTARQQTARTDMKTIDSALTLYQSRHGRFPEVESGLSALVKDKELKELPIDPWGHPYLYSLENGEPVVRTLGADGEPGGEGGKKDLASTDPRPQP